MSISPTILLILYFAGVGIFIILSIFNIYHVIRYSFMRKPSVVITFVYFGLAVAVVVITLQIINDVAWTENLEINLPFNDTVDEGFE